LARDITRHHVSPRHVSPRRQDMTRSCGPRSRSASSHRGSEHDCSLAFALHFHAEDGRATAMSIPERAFPERLPKADPPRPRRSHLSGWRWRPRWRRPRLGRRGKWVLVGLGILVALIVIASFLVDEPLRRTMESQMNGRLKGYTAHIEKLSFHPIGASLTLYNLVFIQNAHPQPPVLRVPRLDASVQWKALIFGRVVANFRFQEPELY